MNKIKMFQHPDHLFDLSYCEVELQSDDYSVPDYKFGAPAVDKCGITLFGQEGGYLRIDACSKDILRIRFSPDEMEVRASTTEELGLIKKDWESIDFNYHMDGHKLQFDGGNLSFHYNIISNNVEVSNNKGNTLISTIKNGIKFSKEKADYSGHKMLAHFNLDDKAVFGFGGRIAKPNRMNTTMDVFSIKVGLHTGDYGGTAIPFFISTKGYGFFFNNPWPHVYFDMGKTNEKEWFLHAPGGECDIFIIKGNSFKEIMYGYTEITGRIAVPDKWLLGFWCSSISFVESSKVIDIVKRMHGSGYPCDVVVLDGPWRGGNNFLEQYMASGEYPSNDFNWHPDVGDGPGMVKELLSMNVKTSLHINSRTFHKDTYEPAVKAGLLRQVGREVVVKLTDKKAEEYYKNFLTPRIQDGVAVWWTDHADRISGEIREGLPSRNLFGALWNKLIAEAMEENGVKNHMCLTRGSGIGGQHYGFPWPGDTPYGMEYYEQDIWFCLNAGLAGFALTSVDLGGFTVQTRGDGLKDLPEYQAFDEENICRRTIHSIFFTPIPRIHNDLCSEPKLPWNCPESTRELYKKYLKVRYELTPYIYSYAIHSSETGEPILRPLVYHHMDDEETFDIANQFYMGEFIMVAPVTERGAVGREIYFPEGNWIHMWTGKRYHGKSRAFVESPLYDLAGLPVFIKSGAILIKQPFSLTLKNELEKEISIEFYPDNNSEAVYYESSTVKNTFTCRESDFTIGLELENNTDMDRIYYVKVFGISTYKDITVENGEMITNPIHSNHYLTFGLTVEKGKTNGINSIGITFSAFGLTVEKGKTLKVTIFK